MEATKFNNEIEETKKFLNENGFVLENMIVGEFHGKPIKATCQRNCGTPIQNTENVTLIPGLVGASLTGGAHEKKLVNFWIQKLSGQIEVVQEVVYFNSVKRREILSEILPQSTWVGPEPKGKGNPYTYVELGRMINSKLGVPMTQSFFSSESEKSRMTVPQALKLAQVYPRLIDKDFSVVFAEVEKIEVVCGDGWRKVTDLSAIDEERCTQREGNCGAMAHFGKGSLFQDCNDKNFVCFFEEWSDKRYYKHGVKLSWGEEDFYTEDEIFNMQVEEFKQKVGINSLLNIIGKEKNKKMSKIACKCMKHRKGLEEEWLSYNKDDCWGIFIAYTLWYLFSGRL